MTTDTITRRYYRPLDVVKLTGATKSHVMAAISAKRLVAYQVGRAWFIPVEAVEDWIHGTAAREEIARRQSEDEGQA